MDPQAQTPVNIKSCVCSNRESREDGSRGLDLQTEIVTDSHRTICANDMFQSVSLQYAELFASELLACITPFICSNLLAYLTETAKQNYFQSVI